MDPSEKVWVLTHPCGWSRMVDRDTSKADRVAMMREHLAAHGEVLLPARLLTALVGGKVLVLRETHRAIFGMLAEDARLLNNVGGVGAQVKVAQDRITLPNGGEIKYLCGANGALEERVRGRRADHIDGAWLIPEDLEAILTLT